MTDREILATIASELKLATTQVAATAALFDDGNTIPFIARYRKEATGTLDEEQLRHVAEQIERLRALDERRAAVLASVEEQGKLTAELQSQIDAAANMTALEDLYAPYRPKRRTRATIAREKGLEPLAQKILAQETNDVEAAAAAGWVAGNVVETRRLLHNAQSSLFPHGLGNGAGHLGRNYMRHGSNLTLAIMPGAVKFHRGTRQSGIILDEQRHHPTRGFAGGYIIETSADEPYGIAATNQANAQVAAAAVTNFDLVQMTRAGVSEDLIISTLRSRGGRLDLSPHGLISLKQQGVSDRVVMEAQMLTRGGGYASPAPVVLWI